MPISREEVEEGTLLQLDFDKIRSIGASGRPLVPVVLQNAETKDVLYVAYTNKEAFDLTMKQKHVFLFSTSRDELWEKGATSGDFLELVEARVNCEQNSLLYLVKPRNAGVCHTKNQQAENRPGCYYRKVFNGQLKFVDFHAKS